MKIMNKILAIILIVSINYNVVLAKGAGTTSLNFLKIGVGARAVSLGDAYVSLSDESNGLYWNPGGLADLKDWHAGFSYNQWFQDINENVVTCLTPQYEWGGLGCSILYLTVGGIEGRDRNDRLTNNVRASDLMVTMSYIKKLDEYGLGASLKYASEKLADQHASTVMIDLGVKRKIIDIVDVGLSIQNIGPGLKYEKESDPLPLIIRLGGNVRYKDFMLASDLIKDEVKYRLGIGLEYEVKEKLFIRYGHRTGEDIGVGLRFGMGFEVKNFTMDYSYGKYGELGYVHRFGLNAKFKVKYPEGQKPERVIPVKEYIKDIEKQMKERQKKKAQENNRKLMKDRIEKIEKVKEGETCVIEDTPAKKNTTPMVNEKIEQKKEMIKK